MKRNNNRNGGRKSNLKRKLRRVDTHLARTVNVMKSGTSLELSYSNVIYGRQTSGNWSFATGGDTRYLAFSTILANSAPFSNLVNIYSEFKIVGAALTVNPYTGVSSTSGIPMLYVSCDPQGSASNPSNGTVITTQTAHVFSPLSLVPQDVRFVFPGIGSNMNIWQDTSATPSGAFYIGANLSVALFGGGNVTAFDCSFELRVQFRNMKTY